MKVELGRYLGKNTHHTPFTNYTTTSFGFVQPLFHQYMNAGDKVSFKTGQLVRLAPMPVPTLGDIFCHNTYRFVPMNEIHPYYDAFLACRSVSTANKDYIPTILPYISNNILFSWLFFGLAGSHSLGTCTCWNATGVEDTEVNITNFSWSDFADDYLSSFGDVHPYPGQWGLSSRLVYLNTDGQGTYAVTRDGADFVLGYPYESGTIHGRYLCIRLNNLGRRIFTILRGLGFSCDFADTTHLCVLPLFAFYKAYFDQYAPQRSINWHSTNAYKFLNNLAVNNITDLISLVHNGDNITLRDMFYHFIDELSSAWYTFPTDWVSAHTEFALNTVPTELTSSVVGQGLVANTVAVGADSNTRVPSLLNRNFPLTQFTLDALRMLTRRATKESLIGGAVYEYMKNKYGEGVADDMFAQSNLVSSSTLKCHIGEVLSNADTGSTGDVLGAYAGLGIGKGSDKVSFKAPNFGYFIGMFVIVPDAKYYQGNDPTLVNLTRDSMPNSDYDALGYELSPRSSIFSSSNSYAGQLYKLDAGFGFIPRLSSWKYKKDIVNGCMRFASVASSFNPYHLDRILTMGTYDADTGTYSDSIPDASTAWRYVGKYPQLGYFNRIFYNNADPSSASFVDDNFIVDTYFDYKLTNCLLPMSESFQSKDEEKDNSTNVVSAE